MDTDGEMKIIKAKAMNGDIVEFRKPAPDEFICPICGAWLKGDLPWVETASVPPSWIPIYDPCPECLTEYGTSDRIRSDVESGEQIRRWDELRIEWLDRLGWPEDKLKQLKENLEIDIVALKRAANRI